MLPKEEWKLLVHYYKWGEDDVNGFIHFPDDYSEDQEKKIEARNRLRERGLIETEQNTKISEGISEMFNLPYLRLTAHGKDIALIYSSRFKRSGLVYAELKNHWLLPIITFIMGVVAAIFVQWACKHFYSQ